MSTYENSSTDNSPTTNESLNVKHEERELPFPVVDERWLAYIPRKLPWGAKRNLDEIPKAHPGTFLVFRVGTRYVAFNGDKHLTGKEEHVVDATAVSLVDMRARNYEIFVPIPSASAADDFTIRITFQARVTSAERAAEEGAIDIKGFLANYLSHDSKLFKLGSGFAVERIDEVRDQVSSRIEAYCELNPIDLPGISVVLASSYVLTHDELRQHEIRMRDERRQQQINKLRAAGEDADIRRHTAYVNDGSDTLTAVGLSRGHTSINEAISNKRDDEKRQQERIAEAFRILQQNGALDYLDIDPTEMANAYLESLTGQPVPHTKRQEVPGAGGEALGPGLDDQDDEIDDDDEEDDAMDSQD